MISIILGVMGASVATTRSQWPGLRNLNSRSVAIVSENITKIGLVVGVTALDEHLDTQLIERINRVADALAENLADNLFDTMDRVRNDIFG